MGMDTEPYTTLRTPLDIRNRDVESHHIHEAVSGVPSPAAADPQAGGNANAPTDVADVRLALEKNQNGSSLSIIPELSWWKNQLMRMSSLQLR